MAFESQAASFLYSAEISLPLLDGFFLLLCLCLCLICSPEATASLLIHLCTRCDTVNGHEEDLARAGHVDDALRVLEDLHHHVLFRLGRRFALWVRARVHNAIHVEIEAVILCAVRVRLARVDGNLCRLLSLNAAGDDGGVVLDDGTIAGRQDMHAGVRCGFYIEPLQPSAVLLLTVRSWAARVRPASSKRQRRGYGTGEHHKSDLSIEAHAKSLSTPTYLRLSHRNSLLEKIARSAQGQPAGLPFFHGRICHRCNSAT